MWRRARDSSFSLQREKSSSFVVRRRSSSAVAHRAAVVVVCLAVRFFDVTIILTGRRAQTRCVAHSASRSRYGLCAQTQRPLRASLSAGAGSGKFSFFMLKALQEIADVMDNVQRQATICNSVGVKRVVETSVEAL